MFTPQEKYRILFVLGYSVFENSGPAFRGINSLDAYEDMVGSIVRDLLDKIDQVRNLIHETLPLAEATSTGGVQVRSHWTLAHHWKVGRQYVNQLATLTKIPIESDIFSSGGAARGNATFGHDPSEARRVPHLKL